jgi:hypothetical protein
MDFNKENIQWIKGSHDLPECIYKIHVPSVSEILSSVSDPELEAFIEGVGKDKADEIMKQAADRGKSMHIFIQQFISEYSKNKDISEALRYTQEQSPKMLDDAGIPGNKIEEGRDLFYKFYYSDYSNQYLDVLGIELAIYSPLYFYRGKLDILYKNKLFGLSITDFKSSNGKIKKGSAKEYKMKLQLGAYSLCIKNMYQEKGITVNYASILCIDKQNDILQEIVLSGAELTDYENKFIELVKEYHIKHEQEYLIK